MIHFPKAPSEFVWAWTVGDYLAGVVASAFAALLLAAWWEDRRR